jgi:hypothetical protein
MAFIVFVKHRGMHAAWLAMRIPEDDLRSCARPFARAQHDPPIVDRILFEQQNLKLSARVRIDAAEAGRDHARVVEDQQIAGLQVLREVTEPAMLDLTREAMQHEQARLVALRHRRLRDQLERQRKIEIRGSHVDEASFQSAGGTRVQFVSSGHSRRSAGHPYPTMRSNQPSPRSQVNKSH